MNGPGLLHLPLLLLQLEGGHGVLEEALIVRHLLNTEPEGVLSSVGVPLALEVHLQSIDTMHDVLAQTIVLSGESTIDSFIEEECVRVDGFIEGWVGSSSPA